MTQGEGQKEEQEQGMRPGSLGRDPGGLQAWARADRLEDLPYLGSGS